MDYAAVVFLEILYMIAFLALISAGLAIVFGMMRVINLAHGEFVMIGGYVTIFANRAGIDIWFAMLVLAPLVVGLVGLVVERLVIRHLYGRMIASASIAISPMTGVEPNETIWLIVPKMTLLETVPAMMAAPPVMTVMNAFAM